MKINPEANSSDQDYSLKLEREESKEMAILSHSQ
jgi:hypothetical protein